MFQDVYITALGLAPPGGGGVADLALALREGLSALSSLHDSPFAGRFVGPSPALPPPFGAAASPSARPRALTLARMAADAIAPQLRPGEGAGTALFLGTVQGCLESLPASGAAFDAPLAPFARPDALAADLRLRLGLTGPCQTLGIACVSSAAALLMGARAVASGRVPRALCGGVEALSPMVMAGFLGLGALATGRPHPFDARRDGMCLSEGAALLLLETRRGAEAAGRRPLLRILGGGEATDAHRMARPHPEGRGAALAARRALADAGLSPGELAFVKGHGTATHGGDLAEARGLFAALGPLPLQALKGHFGHALGATGALETAAVALQYDLGFTARSLGHEDADDAIPLGILPPGGAPAGPALLSWYAFGGAQVALVVDHPPGRAS